MAIMIATVTTTEIVDTRDASRRPRMIHNLIILLSITTRYGAEGFPQDQEY
jgi:hypothetical protein